MGTSIKVEIGWLGPENTKTSGELRFQLFFSVISYYLKYSVSFIINGAGSFQTATYTLSPAERRFGLITRGEDPR